MVRRTGENTVVVDEFDRWVEPLDALLRNTLVQDLGALVPEAQVLGDAVPGARRGPDGGGGDEPPRPVQPAGDGRGVVRAPRRRRPARADPAHPADRAGRDGRSGRCRAGAEPGDGEAVTGDRRRAVGQRGARDHGELRCHPVRADAATRVQKGRKACAWSRCSTSRCPTTTAQPVRTSTSTMPIVVADQAGTRATRPTMMALTEMLARLATSAAFPASVQRRARGRRESQPRRRTRRSRRDRRPG